MRAACLLVTAWALVGCAATTTEVIVVSDTDLAVPGAIDHIRIHVTGPDGLVQEAIADLGAGAPRPATVGLVSRSGTGTLDIVVTGELGGTVVLTRTGHTSFVPGHIVAVRMDLLGACVTTTCGATDTCGETGCRPEEIAASELVPWTGSPPPASFDGGPIDAGLTDTGAGPIDTGTGPVDAGTTECTTAAQCDDGFTCTLDDCVAGHCANTPRDVACDDGLACTSQRCDATAGCVYVADDTLCDDHVACTTDVCDRLMGCVATIAPSACSAGSYCDVTAGCTPGPRFTDVYRNVIQPSCAPCHTMTPVSGGLDMTNESRAYADLVGVTASCGAGVNTRVIAGDSLHSLLWRKVSGVDLCGVRMPRMRTALDQASIDLIAHWIDAGAAP